MGPRAQPDRYEPLPGLLAIPGHLLRKLSPRGRRNAAIAGVLLAIGVAAGLAVAIPAIVDSKQEQAASEARERARLRAQLTAHLKAELREVSGRGTPARGLEGGAALTARRALAADLAGAVQADAVRRARKGEFATAATRAQCSRFPPGVGQPDPAEDLARRTGVYACLAVTAEIPAQESTGGGAIGYPYRARVDFASGRYTFCKISGRPGEGSILRSVVVPVPAACGGA